MKKVVPEAGFSHRDSKKREAVYAALGFPNHARVSVTAIPRSVRRRETSMLLRRSSSFSHRDSKKREAVSLFSRRCK